MGGIANSFSGTIFDEQLAKASRLGKVLDRMDKSGYAAERSNAFKIIQRNLAEMHWDLEGLRTVHSSLTLGDDAAAESEVFVRRDDRGWRKPRDWFTDLVETVAAPLGLYVGCATFGNICQDGYILVGPLVQGIAAGTVIAKIADMALRANRYVNKAMEDDFCAGFCRESLQDFKSTARDAEELAAARHTNEQTQKWAYEDFGFVSWEAPTPRKSDTHSAAAREGQQSAQKRKRDLESSLCSIDKYKMRALGGG